MDKKVETYKANTFRIIEDDEKQIRVQFGFKIKKEEGVSQDVQIVSSNQIDPKLIVPLIERLAVMAVMYQERNNIDLGLNAKISIEEAEEVATSCNSKIRGKEND